jgi:precorrin-8X/cobalt-precorrin-8 methylmutase
MPYHYETDGAAIYRQSFRTIRAEADLARFSPEEERVAVRMIHAAGMVDLAPHIRFSPTFARTAIAALEGGAHGVRRHHPATPARRQCDPLPAA